MTTPRATYEDCAHPREVCRRCGLPLGPRCERTVAGCWPLHPGCVAEPRLPPRDEVRQLWRAGRPVAACSDVSRYLATRGLMPPPPHLARVLPPGTSCPRWARWRRQSWAEAGYRLVLPVFGADGRGRLLRGWRRTPGGPKRVSASGCQVRGMVLANPAGQRLLRTGEGHSVVIVEGEPDYLTACQQWPGYAVLGIGSGWWCEELALRVPDGAWVAIWTDRDAAGDRCAEQIRKTLTGRCTLFRGRAHPAGDVNDQAVAGVLPADPFEGSETWAS